MDNTYWGYHLMLDCTKGNLNVLDELSVEHYLRQLVEKIDMVPYGEPVVKRFATHCPIKGGISAFQLIETSNISLHLVDSTRNGFFDVFSCKEFDKKVVIDFTRKFFEFEKIEDIFLKRTA